MKRFILRLTVRLAACMLFASAGTATAQDRAGQIAQVYTDAAPAYTLASMAHGAAAQRDVYFPFFLHRFGGRI